MVVVTGLVAIALALNDAGTPALEAAPLLRPYVAQLKEDLPATEREKLAAYAEDDLILLHHGYGTAIRNRWLRGDRDKRLVGFFLEHGIQHPDSMSMVLIRALWMDLRTELTAEQKMKNDEENEVRRRKRANYHRLMFECDALLKRHDARITSCFERFGPNSANRVDRSPFFTLTVSADGRVKRVQPYTGGSEATQECLQPILTEFSFSPFRLDSELTVYTLDRGSCRVREIDRLHP